MIDIKMKTQTVNSVIDGMVKRLQKLIENSTYKCIVIVADVAVIVPKDEAKLD